jgi:hypothetical protein
MKVEDVVANRLEDRPQSRLVRLGLRRVIAR